MVKHVLLNNEEHKDLKIAANRSANYGDNVMFTPVYPIEFRSVQAEYPIFFYKDPESGKYSAVALFGFENFENLFLSAEGWDGNYIPLTIERQPFLIGFRRGPDGVSRIEQDDTVIHIDMDHPRVGVETGERVFEEHGGNSTYLDRIADVLSAIHSGNQDSEAFVKLLDEYELLESFVLDIKLNDGSSNRLVGFHTINEEKLVKLSGKQLETLNSAGYLHAIYMTLASQPTIQHLIDRKNKKLKN